MNIQTEILSANISFQEQKFKKPMQLSSGLIAEITEARATVEVRVGDSTAKGIGAIYLSDLWAWPKPEVPHEIRDRVLRSLCQYIATNLKLLCGQQRTHPLNLGLQLHESLCHDSGINDFSSDVELADIPLLARALCGSIFDAAIHDATGQALGCSAYDFYKDDFPVPLADQFFEGHCASRVIRQTLENSRTSEAARSFDAWLIVGAKDSLADEFATWVSQRKYRCFKIKLLARNMEEDAARTSEVFRAALESGALHPRLSVDSNEANPSATSVLQYLKHLRDLDFEAFEALEYLEQPTARDILAQPFDWHEVSSLKPVLLDEGLTSLNLLPEALHQGWSGLAIKTCKGHSFALCSAAWAVQQGLLISLQDLTNPGYAAIHSATLAAHLPSINGVELNSPQYTPAANAPWLPHLNQFFEPHNGQHFLLDIHPVGLGSGKSYLINS